jgi:hypothetical protein
MGKECEKFKTAEWRLPLKMGNLAQLVSRNESSLNYLLPQSHGNATLYIFIMI